MLSVLKLSICASCSSVKSFCAPWRSKPSISFSFFAHACLSFRLSPPSPSSAPFPSVIAFGSW